MSRSGYVDDCDDQNLSNLWRGTVRRSIAGKRGQAFLRELRDAMDAMPEKVLIQNELINSEGDCCTIGVVCKSRGVDVSGVDVEDYKEVGSLVGISKHMAAEIEYLNDEHDYRFEPIDGGENTWPTIGGKQRKKIYETPQERWQRMRDWVESKIIDKQPEPDALNAKGAK